MAAKDAAPVPPTDAAVVEIAAPEKPVRVGGVTDWVYRVFVDGSSLRKVIISAVLFGAVMYGELDLFENGFHFGNLNWGGFLAMTGGVKAIDLNLGKTYPPLVFGYLEDYGAAGRRIYLEGFQTLDTFFPLFGGILNAFATGLLVGPKALNIRCLYPLTLVPLASWLFDWAENFFFISMTLGYPTWQSAPFAWVGYAMSLSKLATLGGSFAIIAALLLAWACKRFFGPHIL